MQNILWVIKLFYIPLTCLIKVQQSGQISNPSFHVKNKKRFILDCIHAIKNTLEGTTHRQTKGHRNY